VNSLSAENISGWYGLIKQVLADFRGQAFKDKIAKLEKYQQLYQAIREIHADYVRLFTGILDDLMVDQSKIDIMAARDRFLSGRRLHSGDRTLSKFDAQNYLKLTEDIGEKRFLLSVITYFYYEMDQTRYATSLEQVDIMIWEAEEFGGLHGWNSASTAFWGAIQYSDDQQEICSLARATLAAIAERFSMLEVTYSELQQSWLNAKPISRSKVSQLLSSNSEANPS
jgi:hypothetical protein